jgi:hypothetical protein
MAFANSAIPSSDNGFTKYSAAPSRIDVSTSLGAFEDENINTGI